MGSLEQAVYAIIISFVIGVILCPIVIPMLRKLKFGQNVRDDGPQTHLAKQGTPTMGGVAFLAAFVITSLFFLKGNRDGAAIMLMTLCYGLIGFLDDYIKVVKKRSLGLRAYQKLLLQLIVTGLFCSYIMKSGIGTAIYIPFTDGKMIDLQLIFIPVLFVAVLGTVNGVNLTDGLDGLAGGVTLLVAAFFMIVAWAAGSTIAPVCGAIVGGLMAFLIFNSYPAKVFMGDTGSLFLGASVALMAIDLKMPIHLILIGFVYFMETLSVIMQTAYFKYTKKKYGEGRRIFKMSPIHHHFEMCGWKEKKIVAVFTLVTVITCAVAYFAI